MVCIVSTSQKHQRSLKGIPHTVLNTLNTTFNCKTHQNKKPEPNLLLSTNHENFQCSLSIFPPQGSVSAFKLTYVIYFPLPSSSYSLSVQKAHISSKQFFLACLFLFECPNMRLRIPSWSIRIHKTCENKVYLYRFFNVTVTLSHENSVKCSTR